MSFKRLDPEDIVISAESITSPVWTGYAQTLTNFYTSSIQENSTTGDFYLDVYNDVTSNSDSEIQFSLAYCDTKGSGSIPFNSNISGSTPSSVNYGTYRNLVLGTEESLVKFAGVQSEYFFGINLERSRFKEKLLPGSFEITLLNGTGSITLTDNSAEISSIAFTDAGRVYELIGSSSVAGIVKEGSDLFNASGSYGLLLPDIGVVLLNGQALSADESVGGLGLTFNRPAVTLSGDIKNTRILFDTLQSFKLNSEETVSSNFVFIRARNSEFNYSTNPSYILDTGELRHSILIDDPKTYVTTIGLYNDNNDLLAVAKLSRPLLKDSRKELLVRLKIDF
jgi:hypothetical protein